MQLVPSRAVRSGLLILLLTGSLGCGATPGAGLPASAAQRYVQALRVGDAAAAHALLDEETRARVSVGELERLMQQNAAELGEQADAIAQSLEDEEIAATARVPYGEGGIVVLELERSRWKILGGVLDAPALRTPRDAVLSLRHALVRRSLPGVLRVLSRDGRSELEAEIQSFLDETEDELALDYEISGNHARVRTSGGAVIVLIREAGEWRVQEVLGATPSGL